MGRELSFIFTITCVLLACTINAQNEVEDETRFSYQNVTHGPQNWGTIHPDWKLCGTGKLQSPIDVGKNKRVLVVPNDHVVRAYKPAPAVIINRGHDIMVRWNGNAGSAKINGTTYKLDQAHWHTPSEHTINERRFKMELHMLHINPAGEMAVIATLYRLGRPDPFLRHLLDEINSATVHHEMHAGEIDPNEIGFRTNKLYSYTGSLTVPPCTEGVNWTILRRTRTVSREQIHALRTAVDDGYEVNSRPLQK